MVELLEAEKIKVALACRTLEVSRSGYYDWLKLLKECEKKWRKINGVAEIKNVLEGLAYRDGTMLPNKTHHETSAS